MLSCIFSFILLFSSNFANKIQDSLLVELRSCSSPHEEIAIYRNLADIAAQENKAHEPVFLSYAVERAKNSNDTFEYIESIFDLTYYYLEHQQIDTASYFLSLIDSINDCDDKYYGRTLINIYSLDYKLYLSTLDSEDIITLFERYRQKNSDNIYEKIEDALAIAILMTYNENLSNLYSTTDYYTNTLSLVNRLPKRQRSNLLNYIYWRLEYVYQKQQDTKAAVDCIEKNHKLFLNKIKKRPFLNTPDMKLAYDGPLALILFNTNYNKAKKHFDNILRIRAYLTLTTDIEYFYHICFNYYKSDKQYSKSLLYLDSLDRLNNHKLSTTLCNNCYERCQIYRKLGDYRTALNLYDKFILLYDSLYQQKSIEYQCELQIKYHIDKLEFNYIQEKSTAYKWQILFYLLLSFVIVSWSIKQYKKRRASKDTLL